jgi:uncharacterized protein (TIGR02996 family)
MMIPDKEDAHMANSKPDSTLPPPDKGAEDAFLRPIFAHPEDLGLRAAYAEWLERRGDPRGEYLRLLLKFHGHHYYRWQGEYQNGVNERLAELGPTLDTRWVAVFDYFDCRVQETRTIQLRIPAAAAPEHQGANLCEVEHHAVALLVILGGWKPHKEPTRPLGTQFLSAPAGQPLNDPVLAVEVPTDPEIERLALSFHREGRSRIETFGPWTVQYLNAGGASGPTRFIFGVAAPWRVELVWKDGEDKPPRWSRREYTLAGEARCEESSEEHDHAP